MAYSWKDVSDYTVHVRFVRQHVPGHDWHRLPIQGLFQPIPKSNGEGMEKKRFD